MISTADAKLISILYVRQNIDVSVSPSPPTDLKMDSMLFVFLYLSHMLQILQALLKENNHRKDLQHTVMIQIIIMKLQIHYQLYWIVLLHVRI